MQRTSRSLRTGAQAAPRAGSVGAGEHIADALSALEFAMRAYRSGRARDAIDGIDDARRVLLAARQKVNEERDAAWTRR